MKIKCAAIRYQDKIYEGTSHYQIGLKMINEGICTKPFPGGKDQGFVTDDGTYVERAPALLIAIESGQVEVGKTVHHTLLFSEDLKGL